MKRNFNLTLKGTELFPLFIVYWVVFLAYEAAVLVLSGRIDKGQTDTAPYLLALFGAIVLFVIVAMIYQILFMRLVMPKIKLAEKSFGFRGSVPKFMLMNLLGAFLSVITLGIYFPWFMAKLTRYLAGETSYDGRNMEFKSRGGKLFLIFLATLGIPLAVLVAAVAAFAMTNGADIEKNPSLMAGMIALIYLFIVPFAYKVYQWFVNGMAWNGLQARWNTGLFRASGFILLQILFSIATVGIGFPAALLYLYRYFTNRTLLMSGGGEAGRMRFEGKIGGGFLLLWGQILLSVITLGIYAPWAFCKTGKWLLTNTVYETGK